MIEQLSKLALSDNGGRRFGKNRREFSYSDYAPERRRLKERRSGFDRRETNINNLYIHSSSDIHSGMLEVPENAKVIKKGSSPI